MALRHKDHKRAHHDLQSEYCVLQSLACKTEPSSCPCIIITASGKKGTASQITQHPDGSLSTLVYRKKTHMVRYMDFTSHHPLTNRIAVARTLMTQVDMICTYVCAGQGQGEETHCQGPEEQWVPSHHVNKNQCTTSNSHQSSPPEDKPRATVVIPYIRHLSKSVQRIQVSLKVHTCFQPQCTL